MTWTPDTPPPCPLCGTRLVERAEPDDAEEGVTWYAYGCPRCGWCDGGDYDNQRLTVATAPWTRDLWADVERTRGEAQGEARAADLHRKLNRRCAEALDLTAPRIDPETGEDYLPSWHDMPEQIAVLREERDTLAARVRELEAETTTWVGLMAQLDRHYPADLTTEGGGLDGPGARVVRLVREVDTLRATLAALAEAVSDEGPVTAAVAPAWDRACAVLSAGWREGQGRNDGEE